MKKQRFAHLVVCLLSACSICSARAINVPEDFETLEAAMEAAAVDDVILVAPGTYSLSEYTLNKRITLASWFFRTGDRLHIEQTVITGSPLTVAASGTRIQGFTWKSSDKGIIPFAKFDLQHCIFRTGGDAVDYEKGSGGYLAHCLFENNGDDGIDLDEDVDIVIEHNVIRNNKDDGIEIRLQDYEGPLATYIIRHNVITGNNEDGIQLIDYPGKSDRVFYIHNNLIAGNAMVGVGSMPDGNTRENYGGSPQVEKVVLYNNTIVGNDHGITGGANMLAFNNIIANSTRIGAKNVNGASMIAYTILHGNATHVKDSNLGQGILYTAPRYDRKYKLLAGSPCIDAGAATLEGIHIVDFSGTAPDLGAYEYGTSRIGGNRLPGVNGGNNLVITAPADTVTLKASLTGSNWTDSGASSLKLRAGKSGVKWDEVIITTDPTFNPTSLCPRGLSGASFGTEYPGDTPANHNPYYNGNLLTTHYQGS